MTTAIVKQEQSFETALQELESMQNMCNKLLQMKHYQKLGDVGIFAILQKAKSVGLNPLDALNGGMYFVNGKVELSANTMNYLIRQAGHSVTKDERSTKEICILKGKRCDNGDTFTCSFSIDDARKAGILKNVWMTYPEDMLFARALTRLARQLFPDVCKGCYLEGEIPTTNETKFDVDITPDFKVAQPQMPVLSIQYISQEQAMELEQLVLDCDPEKQQDIWKFLDKKCGGRNLEKLKSECYSKIKSIILERRAEYQLKLVEKQTTIDEVVDAE